MRTRGDAGDEGAGTSSLDPFLTALRAVKGTSIESAPVRGRFYMPTQATCLMTIIYTASFWEASITISMKLRMLSDRYFFL